MVERRCGPSVPILYNRARWPHVAGTHNNQSNLENKSSPLLLEKYKSHPQIKGELMTVIKDTNSHTLFLLGMLKRIISWFFVFQEFGTLTIGKISVLDSFHLLILWAGLLPVPPSPEWMFRFLSHGYGVLQRRSVLGMVGRLTLDIDTLSPWDRICLIRSILI